MNSILGTSEMRRRTGGQSGLTLIELLVSMAIMGMLSAMILTAWFALSRSYTFTVSNSNARDSAQQAISFMQREVRDAQRPPGGYISVSSASDAVVYRARPYSIIVSTTFNKTGNDVMAWSTATPTPSASPTKPHLVAFRLYSDRELWRFEDTDGNGVISGVNVGQSYPTEFSLAEQVNGEGAKLLLANVVNYTAHAPTHIPLFDYNYYDSNGVLRSADTLTGTDRYSIIAVQIRILADLNPAQAPVYADLRSTAELRNAR